MYNRIVHLCISVLQNGALHLEPCKPVHLHPGWKIATFSSLRYLLNKMYFSLVMLYFEDMAYRKVGALQIQQCGPIHLYPGQKCHCYLSAYGKRLQKVHLTTTNPLFCDIFNQVLLFSSSTFYIRVRFQAFLSHSVLSPFLISRCKNCSCGKKTYVAQATAFSVGLPFFSWVTLFSVGWPNFQLWFPFLQGKRRAACQRAAT